MSSEVETKNWGRLGYLNEEQRSALDDFKEKIDASKLARAKYDAENDEQVCLRFLRARKFDVEKATSLLSECCEIFDQYDADQCKVDGGEKCASCDPDVLTTFYPHTQCGYDKEGRLLLWEANGCVNLHALETVVRRSNLIKYHFWTMQDKLNELFKLAPKDKDDASNTVITTTAVLDFDGLCMHHMSTRMFSHLKTMIAIDNVCYPEMLGKLIVVNAPTLASTGWKMVKGWLDPRTQEKIEIHGTDKSKANLLNLINSEDIPVSMGGTGPEVFNAKPYTAYISVPRSSSIVRGVVVEPYQSINIDSYVRDDQINVTVEAYDIGADEVYDESNTKVASNFPSTTPEVLLAETNMKTDSKDESQRHLHHFQPSEKRRLFKITYRNQSGWYQRWMVYSFTVIDTDGVPVFKKSGENKGPLRLTPSSDDTKGDETPTVFKNMNK